MARDTRDIEKEGKCKTKTIRTVYQHNKDNKILTSIFCLWKRIYFARKWNLGKRSLYYYISSKVLFSVAGYLKRK